MNKPVINLNEVKEFIENSSSSSKIYLGCDSSCFRKGDKWWADYVTVIVVHHDGNKGCKIFGELKTEPDYTHDKTKPMMRLMNEAYKVVELYENIKESIGDRYREIHLDINTDESHNSHLVLAQAAGYVRGVCGIEPKLKPEAFASSAVADRFMRVKNYDIRKVDPSNEEKRRKRINKLRSKNPGRPSKRKGPKKPRAA
jgi:predicted RNase H-related nuclease YkuK (DUF458 family)